VWIARDSKIVHLLYAVLGEFEALLNNRQAAKEYFRKALELATIESERKFLMKNTPGPRRNKKLRAFTINFRI
jgi:predicted RNA polymerase sigma factor